MKFHIPNSRRAMVGGALAALAIAGVGATTAASSAGAAAHPRVSQNAVTVKAPTAAEAPEPGAPDTDNVQSGDQTGPDAAGKDTGAAETPAGPDTDNVQSGDQSGPDTPGAAG
jgi:hypothetical protein